MHRLAFVVVPVCVLMSGVLPAAAQEIPPEVPDVTELIPDDIPPEPAASPGAEQAEPDAGGGAEPTTKEPAASAEDGDPGTEQPDEPADERLRDVIVVLRRSVEAPARVRDVLERRFGFEADRTFRRVVEGFSARLGASDIRGLEDDPRVAAVVPDRRVRIAAEVPVVASDEVPPGVQRVGAGSAVATRQASSANVAVLDTGIDLSHPDLNALHGADCIDGGPAEDDNGHGTHVAGTIAAENDGTGVVGVAPGTPVWAVKVLDRRGSGSWSSIICGIDWARGTHLDADPGNDIAVVNMSLGGTAPFVSTCPTAEDPLHQAICTAEAAGITFVVAAGNEGVAFDSPGSLRTPAVYPEVLTVSAFADRDGQAGGLGGAFCGQTDDAPASFSNHAATSSGAAHLVSAPGVCIESSWPGGDASATGLLSGTSMATPHVAGAVALCLSEGGSAGPCTGMTPAQVRERIRTESENHALAASEGALAAGSKQFGYRLWALDVTPPAVVSRSPADGSLVRPDTSVRISFSEPMDRAATQAAVSVMAEGSPVAGTFSWSGTTLTLTPTSSLPERTSIDLTVAQTATDLAGRALAEPVTTSFRTLASLAAAPSTVSIQRGTRRAGTAVSLAADDGAVLKVRADGGRRPTTQWFGQLTGVPNDLQDLVVTYSGRNSRTCAQKIALYRWSDGRWVTVDSRTVGKTEQVIAKAVGSPDRYVSGTSGPGSVRVRVRCVRGTDPFTAIADRLSTAFHAP